MTIGLIGKKLGMTRVFNAAGKVIPVTALQVGPCPVLQIKRKETDGYTAVQIGYDPLPARKVNKVTAGHFKKSGVAPTRRIREFRLPDVGEFELGKALDVSVFVVGEKVDVCGVSKGRGHAGAVKRHHTKGGPESHGSMYGRLPGSMGASSFPSRVWKGKTLSGHMGAERSTTINLEVVKVDVENNVILVRGAVPGHNRGYVTIRKSVRKAQRAARG